MIKDYNPSIDALKGILILFVMAGHILPGGLNSSFLRYSIYAFHMPLFLFISGYLINLEKSVQLDFAQLIKKYWKRMLLEWGIAWIIYTSFILFSGISFHKLLSMIIHPFYHLWYVPALFGMIIILVLLYRYLSDKFLTYVILFSLTVVTTSFCFYKQILNPYHVSLYTLFLLGTLSSSINVLKNRHHGLVWGGVSLAIFIASLLLIWSHSETPFETFAQYVQIPCSILLCVFILVPIIEFRLIKSKVLEFFGRNSLHFYLWHMLPIVIINYKDFV